MPADLTLPNPRFSVFDPDISLSLDEGTHAVPRVCSSYVTRAPLYNLLFLVEGGDWGAVIDALFDTIFNCEDFRHRYAIGTLEIRLVNQARSTTGSTIASLVDRHMLGENESLEIIAVVTQPLDCDEARCLRETLINAGRNVAIRHSVGINMIQIGTISLGPPGGVGFRGTLIFPFLK